MNQDGQEGQAAQLAIINHNGNGNEVEEQELRQNGQERRHRQ